MEFEVGIPFIPSDAACPPPAPRGRRGDSAAAAAAAAAGGAAGAAAGVAEESASKAHAAAAAEAGSMPATAGAAGAPGAAAAAAAAAANKDDGPAVYQTQLNVEGTSLNLLRVSFVDRTLVILSDDAKVAAWLEGSTDEVGDSGVRFILGDRAKRHYIVYAQELLLRLKDPRGCVQDFVFGLSIQNESPAFFRAFRKAWANAVGEDLTEEEPMLDDY
ncbi:hypothetical protein, conserved [Eimeria tenella]|uniref:Uncharacterized protein n=1 Tax=Eimeria tenella TaxID=5802 RepID=U6KK07_EIMTE|nr:hypothetical protein, conserved [Eimeria tenella]CDJ37146.1 hypothetical protein, conserved [Eimeria tenella]|eukprot:XP_013227984.1 hypothetical protein, conserved [Eimeria tenella]